MRGLSVAVVAICGDHDVRTLDDRDGGRAAFFPRDWQPLPYSIGQSYVMQEIDESRVVAKGIAKRTDQPAPACAVALGLN